MITTDTIIFHKYHGTGNDFIMINNLNGDITLKPDFIKQICDRHFGIGADGLILIEKPSLAGISSKAGFFMNYINSDGTMAEMCGNGIRCAVKFFLDETKNNYKESKLRFNSVYVETRAGIKKVEVNDNNIYSVNMGLPKFESPDFPSSTGPTYGEIEGYNFNFVSMGNPHAVTEVENLNIINIKEIGSRVEINPLFPNKINVEFFEKISETYYKVKVWERSCGETFACGTGACAVFSIIDKLSNKIFLANEEIILEFPGGKLYLSKNHEGEIILRGPATFVFKGEIY